jgi:selenobiotic family peptide radical SAM maturase
MTESTDSLSLYFPNCRRILSSQTWDRILLALNDRDPSTFIGFLEKQTEDWDLPAFLPDLATIEYHYNQIGEKKKKSLVVTSIMVNPDLVLIPVKFAGLPDFFNQSDHAGIKKTIEKPRRKQGYVLVWWQPESYKIMVGDAVDDDLLALKLVTEKIDARHAAEQGDTTIAKIEAVLHRAADLKIILCPESRIRRDPGLFSENHDQGQYLKAEGFTLQWHITQACDLHCRHCYDRSDRVYPALKEAESILDQLYDFSKQMHVRCHVTFTGGNPLMYPDFQNLYKAAADRGFSLAILGNPASKNTLERFLDIQPMTHFQISLEGLEEYNDYIRGAGHFKRSFEFLDTLKDLGIYSMVMLTLNKENMDQVLPLGRLLTGRADSFTFNRLAMVGEGKDLALPEPELYKAFLTDYLNAMDELPVLSLKDNLFNIAEYENQKSVSGGCTGHGCGAAFNFVSLLSDGEVHACRKFPSFIGSIKENSLLEIYNSPLAGQYRKGALACHGCRLITVCRGCPAVVYGMGLDPFESRDPFCFYSQAPDEFQHRTG